LEHAATFTRTTDTSNKDMGHVERYGDSLIKECEIEIGGQRIDKHTSMWNRVWSDLTQFNPSGHFGAGTAPATGDVRDVGGSGTLYQLMTGNGFGLNAEVNDNGANKDFAAVVNGTTTGTVNGFVYNSQGGTGGSNVNVERIFLPLNFWFCRNPGLALPLIALQYHEVKVKMTFETTNNLTREFENGTAVTTHTDTDTPTNKIFDLWCDYIYLDTDERRRFAQVSHEYLIEQLQYSENTISSGSPSIDLNFNHPVKELIWCSRNTGSDGRNSSTPTDATAGPVSLDAMGGNWKLKLNGHDRFKDRDSKYFTRTQVWQHHTGYGAVPTVGDCANDLSTTNATVLGGDSIAVYSFALKPEEHQPSGTCNFSRIDNAQLVGSSIVIPDEEAATVDNTPDGSSNTLSLTIFAVNYNVLRIMSGMGGLAYSN